MDVMMRRRALMGMQSLLPGAYQKMEWIAAQSGVGQYIDSGVIVPYPNTLTVQGRFKFTDNKGWQSAFGGKGPEFCLQQNASNASLLAQLNGKSNYNIANFTFGEDIEFEMSRASVTVNGVEKSITDGTIHYNEPIWLFGKMALNTTKIDIAGSAVIYQFKIYDDRTLVRNFVPCIRKLDNKPGMYDTVSKTFYTNAGKGEFIVPN